MENTNTKTQVQKIEAEKVNEIERATNRDGSLSLDSKVTVKILNKVFEIKIRENYNKEIEVNVESQIEKQIEDFGIEADYSSLKKEYAELLVGWKKEEEEKKIVARKEAYKKFWGHTFKKEVEEIGSPGISVSVLSEETFIKDSGSHSYNAVTVNYNNTATEVKWEDCSSNSYRLSTPKNMKYLVYGSITDYKRRTYKKIASVIKTIKELVDSEISKQEAKEEKENTNTNVFLALEKIKIKGCEVSIEKRYSQRYRSHNLYDSYHDGFKVFIKWEGGKFSSETRDAEHFTLPTTVGSVDLETLKRFANLVKDFA